MKKLQELVHILGDDHLPLGTRKIDIRVKKLYDYIKFQQEPKGDVAARLLGVKEGGSDFRKVKYYLKIALINGVLAINDASEKSLDSRSNVNDSIWNHLQGSVTKNESVSRPFIDYIADIGLAKARSFDLQEPLVIGGLSVINSTYANQLRKSEYLSLLRSVEDELECDYTLQICYKHFKHLTYLNITRESRRVKVIYLTKAVNEIRSIKTADRTRVRHISIILELNLRMMKSDFDEAITFAENILNRIDEADPKEQQVIAILRNNLSRAYLNSGRHDDGLRFAFKVLSSTDPKKYFAYYSAKELAIVMAMRCGKYQLAYDHFIDVMQEDLGVGLASNYEETQSIIGAYLYILIEMGLVKSKGEEHSLIRLRIGKFLNETVASQKEKSLRNLHVIIIKILEHSLLKRDKDFNQEDAIRKYVQRHLSKPEAVRAKNFILALIKFPENGYNKKIVAREADKYLARLRAHKIGDNNQHPYGEIVLYESIWDHLMAIQV